MEGLIRKLSWKGGREGWSLEGGVGGTRVLFLRTGDMIRHKSRWRGAGPLGHLKMWRRGVLARGVSEGRLQEGLQLWV